MQLWEVAENNSLKGKQRSESFESRQQRGCITDIMTAKMLIGYKSHCIDCDTCRKSEMSVIMNRIELKKQGEY